MPRLRIKTARKHQHKERAHCNAQSAHFIPQSNLRMLVIPGRLAIPKRIARQKSPHCLHSMIAPIEREPGTPRADAADQSIFETRSTGRAPQAAQSLQARQNHRAPQTHGNGRRKRIGEFGLKPISPTHKNSSVYPSCEFPAPPVRADRSTLRYSGQG